MSNFNPESFKVGPCVVAYKGQLLGATRDGVNITLEQTTVDISCDQSYGQPVRRVVSGVKVTAAMTMLEIDANLALLLDENRITDAVFGADLLQKGGELLLTPVDANDTTGYRFPNAVPEPDAAYSLSSAAAHSLQLRFTAHYNAGGEFFERVTV